MKKQEEKKCVRRPCHANLILRKKKKNGEKQQRIGGVGISCEPNGQLVTIRRNFAHAQ